MSRIGDLIAEQCPDGVTFKELGEVGEFIRGRRFTKDDVVSDGVGSIHYGEIYTLRHIASILDKFDVLVNDLSVGLPAEIKARRRQYEHDRDRLLTFREAA